MANKDNDAAVPFLRWSGKGGSGVSAMTHYDPKTKTTSPWDGLKLADELKSHAEAGNTVSFGAIHQGQIVGESKPSAKKPAAKPAAKATKPVGSKSAKATDTGGLRPTAVNPSKKPVIAKKAAAGLGKAKGAAKPAVKKTK